MENLHAFTIKLIPNFDCSSVVNRISTCYIHFSEEKKAEIMKRLLIFLVVVQIIAFVAGIPQYTQYAQNPAIPGQQLPSSFPSQFPSPFPGIPPTSQQPNTIGFGPLLGYLSSLWSGLPFLRPPTAYPQQPQGLPFPQVGQQQQFPQINTFPANPQTALPLAESIPSGAASSKLNTAASTPVTQIAPLADNPAPKAADEPIEPASPAKP